MKNIKVKVCGMKYPDNIQEIASLRPDFMGFIFYDKSKRFVGDNLYPSLLQTQEGIKRVGVFVNASVGNVLITARKYSFEYVQLHGDENPEFCKKIWEAGLKVIKAFSIDDNFEFDSLHAYSGVCDYFLFDTKGENFGGNGKRFNWEILKKYNNTLPIFLSGGISEEDASEIMGIEGLNLYAVDINSKFEIEPGLKEYNRVKNFIEDIRVQNRTI